MFFRILDLSYSEEGQKPFQVSGILSVIRFPTRMGLNKPKLHVGSDDVPSVRWHSLGFHLAKFEWKTRMLPPYVQIIGLEKAS